MRAGYERLREGIVQARLAHPDLASAVLPEGESRRSAYVSESDDAEFMDVAAASATDGWAIGRDRAR
ncbi:hypothetical protein [Streptomyces sp. NBC_00401]|uniref:hypothetical protein n=1 Tax=Streptomyces sp. NBC_00401 TaxID=2975738 RepID=UPI00225AA22A|nr:hypothetical protein [Streptomyces sp. NBC_00401]MCX5086471.1 hypothetical protein [Streptomyces sp. NBC_00401]